MDSDRINTIKETIEQYELHHIYLNFVDIRGSLWTKTVGVKELLANTHVSWTDGISINGRLIDGFNLDSDGDWLVIVPDPTKFYRLSFIDEPQQFAGALLCSIKDSELDSRYVLLKAVEYSKSLGFAPVAGLQLIFGIKDVFAEKAYQSFVFNTSNTFNNEVVDSLLKSEIDVEYYLRYCNHSNRIDLVPDEMNLIADKFTMAKWYTQALGLKHSIDISFTGLNLGKGISSCPIHMSLWDKNKGNNLFFDPNRELELSLTGEYFVNGILAFLPSIIAIISATSSTPIASIIDNYTPSVSTLRDQCSAISIPLYFEEKKKADRIGWSKRCIFNLGLSNSNIYLLLASLLYAGLYGITNKLEKDGIIESLTPGHVRNHIANNQYLRERMGENLIDKLIMLL